MEGNEDLFLPSGTGDDGVLALKTSLGHGEVWFVKVVEEGQLCDGVSK